MLAGIFSSNKVRVQVNAAVMNPANTTPLFQRGDKMTGQVLVECSKMQKFRLISVQFTGAVRHWNGDCKVEVNDKLVDQITYLKTAPGVEDVYNLDSVTMGRSLTPSVALLQEGNYSFPYSFNIPDNAIPSCQRHGSIAVQYYVKATLHGEGNSTMTSTQVITVGSSMNEEQHAIEAASPQRFMATSNLVRNSLILKGSGQHGTADITCNLSSTLLVVTKATDGIQLSIDVDNANGQQPIEWAKAELQMIIQSDWKRYGCLTQYNRHNTKNPGDFQQVNVQSAVGGAQTKRTELVQVTESTPWGGSTVMAQGSQVSGYTSQDLNRDLFNGSLNRTNTCWSTKLAGNKVAPASRGEFRGTVLLDVTKPCIPTARSEFCQVNWRVAITLSHVDKTFYLPVVVVDAVQSPAQALQSAAAAGPHSPVPWFHHEKYVNSMHQNQQYEVPSMGHIVTATAAPAAPAQHVAGGDNTSQHPQHTNDQELSSVVFGTVVGAGYKSDDPYSSHDEAEEYGAAAGFY